MSTGERLRRARLDAGKTLEQVAAETKIQLWILEALEREDFSRVPGGVFIRGYLTAFARAVGLNPSEILTEYAQETAPPPVPPAPSPPPDLNSGQVTPAWQYVAIAAIVLVAVVMWRNTPRSDPDVTTGPAPPPVVTARAPAPPSAAAVARARPTESGATATSGVTPEAAGPSPGDPTATAAAAAPLVVQLHANTQAWIEASTDGERKTYRLVMAGEDLRLDAQNQIRLLVGDAGAVRYTINSKPARSLGRPGVVREIVITPNNYQTFVDNRG